MPFAVALLPRDLKSGVQKRGLYALQPRGDDAADDQSALRREIGRDALGKPDQDVGGDVGEDKVVLPAQLRQQICLLYGHVGHAVDVAIALGDRDRLFVDVARVHARRAQLGRRDREDAAARAEVCGARAHDRSVLHQFETQPRRLVLAGAERHAGIHLDDLDSLFGGIVYPTRDDGDAAALDRAVKLAPDDVPILVADDASGRLERTCLKSAIAFEIVQSLAELPLDLVRALFGEIAEHAHDLACGEHALVDIVPNDVALAQLQKVVFVIDAHALAAEVGQYVRDELARGGGRKNGDLSVIHGSIILHRRTFCNNCAPEGAKKGQLSPLLFQNREYVSGYRVIQPWARRRSASPLSPPAPRLSPRRASLRGRI